MSDMTVLRSIGQFSKIDQGFDNWHTSQLYIHTATYTYNAHDFNHEYIDTYAHFFPMIF